MMSKRRGEAILYKRDSIGRGRAELERIPVMRMKVERPRGRAGGSLDLMQQKGVLIRGVKWGK